MSLVNVGCARFFHTLHGAINNNICLYCIFCIITFETYLNPVYENVEILESWHIIVIEWHKNRFWGESDQRLKFWTNEGTWFLQGIRLESAPVRNRLSGTGSSFLWQVLAARGRAKSRQQSASWGEPWIFIQAYCTVYIHTYSLTHRSTLVAHKLPIKVIPAVVCLYCSTLYIVYVLWIQ